MTQLKAETLIYNIKYFYTTQGCKLIQKQTTKSVFFHATQV